MKKFIFFILLVALVMAFISLPTKNQITDKLNFSISVKVIYSDVYDLRTECVIPPLSFYYTVPTYRFVGQEIGWNYGYTDVCDGYIWK